MLKDIANTILCFFKMVKGIVEDIAREKQPLITKFHSQGLKTVTNVTVIFSDLYTQNQSSSFYAMYILNYLKNVRQESKLLKTNFCSGSSYKLG